MTAIDDFLAGKQLSANSQSAYRYDLEQFRRLVAGTIDADRLRLYQAYVGSLKPAAQKRKLSTVNQFLYHLYETGQLKTYHKLKQPVYQLPQQPDYQRMDLTALQVAAKEETGQLIALLMAYLGLQPKELTALKSSDVNLEFQVMTVTRGREKRVLELPDFLPAYLQERLEGTYLFDKVGQPYSRQWLFKQLNRFLAEIGLPDLNGQRLRDQFILAQLAEQRSLPEIAQKLGLKTVITLEKYVKNNGYKD